MRRSNYIVCVDTTNGDLAGGKLARTFWYHIIDSAWLM